MTKWVVPNRKEVRKKKKILQRFLRIRVDRAGGGIKGGFFTMARTYFGNPTLTKGGVYAAIETVLENEAATTPKAVPKLKSAFYDSAPWLLLRYKVLTTYPKKCMCCGGRSPIHVDHIKPRSKHPQFQLEFNNLQVLCHDCNIGKKAWDMTDWRPVWAQEEYPLP